MSTPGPSYGTICAIITLSVVASVRSASASRIEFVAWYDGKRVEQAEICFFPGDVENLFRSYFKSDDVRCLPADQVHEIPVGVWHFFARHRRGLVSAWPGLINTSRHVDGYKRVRVNLVPAVTLNVRSLKDSLREGEHAVIYFPSAPDDKLSFLLPVTKDDSEILIPAGRTFVPITAARAVPTWVGVPQQLSNDGQAIVNRNKEATGSLVAWVTFDREGLRRLGWPQRTLAPLRVFVRSQKGRELDALSPVLYFGEPELAIVPNLSDPPVEIVLKGKGWRTVSRAVETPVGRPGLIAMTEPLHATMLAEVVVEAPLQAASGVEPCPDEPAATEPAVSLWNCGTYGPTSSSASVTPGCEVIVGEESIAKGTRSVRFQNVEPGRYWITVSAGVGTRWHEVLDVDPGGSVQRFVEPQFSAVSGRVTQDDKPVHAKISFATGFSFSDPVTGYYRAPVTRDPGNKQVQIKRCDSGQVFLEWPDRELRAGDVFDVELPAAPLTLEVVNAATRAPIEGADCKLNVDDAGHANLIALQRTNSAGRSSIGLAGEMMTALESSKGTICCEHAAFETGCVSYDQKTPDIVRVELRPSEHTRTKILAQSPIIGGRLYWISPVAGVVERSLIESDGSVVRKRPPSPDEYAVFVSRSHPLHAWPVAALFGGTISLAETGIAVQVQPGPGRNEPTRITIALGPLVVPLAALTYHQAMRLQAVELTPGQTMVIPDIAPSAPMSVIVGYRVSATPPAPEGFEPDYFLRPEHLRAFTVLPVGPSLRVDVP